MDKTSKIVHQTKENFMNANSEGDVFEKVFKSFPSFKNIVVWNYNTYIQFVECSKRSGQKLHRIRVIILQDILSTVASYNRAKFRFEMMID